MLRPLSAEVCYCTLVFQPFESKMWSLFSTCASPQVLSGGSNESSTSKLTFSFSGIIFPACLVCGIFNIKEILVLLAIERPLLLYSVLLEK